MSRVFKNLFSVRVQNAKLLKAQPEILQVVYIIWVAISKYFAECVRYFQISTGIMMYGLESRPVGPKNERVLEIAKISF